MVRSLDSAPYVVDDSRAGIRCSIRWLRRRTWLRADVGSLLLLEVEGENDSESVRVGAACEAYLQWLWKAFHTHSEGRIIVREDVLAVHARLEVDEGASFR